MHKLMAKKVAGLGHGILVNSHQLCFRRGRGPTFREFAVLMVSRQPPGAQLSLGPALDGYLWLREASSKAPLINYEGRHMWVRTGELRA